jgi:hypothetical protein
VLLPGYNVTNSSEAWPKARATAERALALDSTLAAARTTLAYGTFMFDSDWRAAEQGFRRQAGERPRRSRSMRPWSCLGVSVVTVKRDWTAARAWAA